MIGERVIVTSHSTSGELSANAVYTDEFPFSVTYIGSKACGSVTDNGTLAVAGGATATAAAIGGDNNPNYIQPASPTFVAKNTAITFTVDYDATTETATNVSVINIYLIGDE